MLLYFSAIAFDEFRNHRSNDRDEFYQAYFRRVCTVNGLCIAVLSDVGWPIMLPINAIGAASAVTAPSPAPPPTEAAPTPSSSSSSWWN